MTIAQNYAKIVNRCAQEFGLTPSARSRLIASAEIAEDDEMDKLLGGE